MEDALPEDSPGELDQDVEVESLAFEAPVRVKRRLSGKQTPPEAGEQPQSAASESASSDGAVSSVWQNFDKQEWEALDHRHKYLKLLYRFTRWAEKEANFSSVNVLCPLDKDPTDDELMQHALSGLRKMSKVQKGKAFGRFCSLSSAPEEVTEMVKDTWGCASGERRWAYAKSVLLTWNGDWGVVKVPDDVHLSSVDDVVSYVRGQTSMLKLWQRFLDHIKDEAEFQYCKVYACSFELCTGTWQDSRQVRVHGHAFLFRPDARMSIRSPASVKFLGSLPHKATEVNGGTLRSGQGWGGCYYVLCPKVGSIFTGGSVESFKDFPVSPQWIVGLVQAKKMTFESAHREMAYCGRSFSRVTQDLKAWEAAQSQLALQQKALTEQRLHHQNNLKFQTYPQVQQWWTEATQPHQRRKKFLVIQGPSGVGKTEFIKSLAGPGATLEISADGMTSPYLRNFQAEKHRVIFWDECQPKLVCMYRKLFQCPASWITLGVSPTGRDVYTVWVNDAVMIIASNCWLEALEELEKESDREWIRHNQVLLVVQEKMFLEEGATAAALPLTDGDPGAELPLDV